MAALPLTGTDAEQFARAQQAASGGDFATAAQILAGLIAAGQRHLDVLMLYSAVCEPLGKANDAIGACHAAAQAAPDRADVLANLGRLLHEQGRSAEALSWFDRAIALDAGDASTWYNLALATFAVGNGERAAEALRRAAELKPDWAMAWSTLGLVEEQIGEIEQAEADLRHALGIDPSLASARHYLAVTLRRLGRPEDALEWTEGVGIPETRLLRAHLLSDLGRAEAVESYRAVLNERPDLTDAHETLANLLPQLGRSDEALNSYRDALARAPSPQLYLSAIGSARSLRDYLTMQQWVEEAKMRLGPLQDLRAFEGLALFGLGETEAGLAVLEPLAAEGFGAVLGHCAYGRLKLGDLDQAEAHALAATEALVGDQTPWAYLTIIWRLKQDLREQWLADYGRLVMPVDIEAPAGFATSADFMQALAAELHARHTTTEHPAEQSLRQGTQTRGSLFNLASPLIRALADRIRTQLEEPLAKLAPDDTHPFLSRNTGRVEFVTSWSVRLRTGGFHVHHIHHKGWLSSALYVELPPGVGVDAPDASDEGALAFGVPPEDLGIDLKSRRVVAPKVGRLVVFPSYFWHGTIPFGSDKPRLTVAFDAMPA